MKLTIKTNGHFNYINATADGVELDFENNSIWCDFELWLEDGEKLKDYKRITRTKTNKLKMF